MNDTNLCYRRFDLNTGSEDVGVYGVMGLFRPADRHALMIVHPDFELLVWPGPGPSRYIAARMLS
jgi:hypothetical protein